MTLPVPTPSTMADAVRTARPSFAQARSPARGPGGDFDAIVSANLAGTSKRQDDGAQRLQNTVEGSRTDRTASTGAADRNQSRSESVDARRERRESTDQSQPSSATDRSEKLDRTTDDVSTADLPRKADRDVDQDKRDINASDAEEESGQALTHETTTVVPVAAAPTPVVSAEAEAGETSPAAVIAATQAPRNAGETAASNVMTDDTSDAGAATQSAKATMASTQDSDQAAGTDDNGQPDAPVDANLAATKTAAAPKLDTTRPDAAQAVGRTFGTSDKTLATADPDEAPGESSSTPTAEQAAAATEQAASAKSGRRTPAASEAATPASSQSAPVTDQGQDLAPAKGGTNAAAGAARPDATSTAPTPDRSAKSDEPMPRIFVAHETAPPPAPSFFNAAFSAGHTLTVAPSFGATLAATAPTPTVTAPIPLDAVPVEIASRAQAGINRFEIRLDPPELGRIDVRLDVDARGHVVSHLTIDRGDTFDMLRRDASQLQRALQDAGLKTGDGALQFSLRDQSAGNGQHNDDSPGRRAYLLVSSDEAVVTETATRGYGRMLGASNGLDIRV